MSRRKTDLNDNETEKSSKRRRSGGHTATRAGKANVAQPAQSDTWLDRRLGRKAKQPRVHKQNFVSRLVNQWFDRVFGAMRGGGLADADSIYAPHKTTRDFIWNTAGAASWALVFPIVSIVATRLVGLEQAGMISMAFVVAILLMFLGNFGVRTYQISDTQRQHSFADYQINRWITCIVMLFVGWAYCSLRGYDSLMFDISMGVIAYKFFDALADVYEGRLQQVDKLYLGGISQTLRSLASLAVFCLVLLITRNSVWASYGMAITAGITFVAFTWPLALLETPKSRPASLPSIVKLFKMCAPLFVAIFFFNVVENMPKFAMEAQLTYDNQLYYNALYFPAQMILISAQLVYKPLLLRMAGVWQDTAKRMKFDLLLLGLLAVIVAITAIVALIMAGIGVPVLSFLYGVDFEPYRSLMFIMLITGGLQAAIDFLYQAITIMRRQKDVTVLFVMTFIFSLFIPILLVGYAGLEGAVLSYLFIEAILFILLGWEYFKIRMEAVRSAKSARATQNTTQSNTAPATQNEQNDTIPAIIQTETKETKVEGEDEGASTDRNYREGKDANLTQPERRQTATPAPRHDAYDVEYADAATRLRRRQEARAARNQTDSKE